MINYTGKYPISLQSKKDMWYNIRPCSFADMKPEKTAEMFITQICKAIHETPNKLNNKEKTDHIHQSNRTRNIASNTGGVAIFPNKSL